MEKYVPQDEFFDEAMLKRIDDAKDTTSDEENKAARNVPKNVKSKILNKPNLKQSLTPKKVKTKDN